MSPSTEIRHAADVVMSVCAAAAAAAARQLSRRRAAAALTAQQAPWRAGDGAPTAARGADRARTAWS